MIRIVAGEWGGRRIATPPGRATRPTSEKVRGAIFNVLQARASLDEAECWDLFAGSGAMGLEALSRGARRVHFVESDSRTAALVRETLEALGADPRRWTVSAARAESWLDRAPAPAAPLIVFMDPPYAADSAERLLPRLAALASVPAGAWIVLESASRAAPAATAGLELVQVKRYGGTSVQFLRKGESERGEAGPEQERPGSAPREGEPRENAPQERQGDGQAGEDGDP